MSKLIIEATQGEDIKEIELCANYSEDEMIVNINFKGIQEFEQVDINKQEAIAIIGYLKAVFEL